jgi:hypothetical protein
MNEIVEVEITGAYRNSVSGNIITHEIEGPIPQSDENMAVAAQ